MSASTLQLSRLAQELQGMAARFQVKNSGLSGDKGGDDRPIAASRGRLTRFRFFE